MPHHSGLASLTERERECLRLAGAGLTSGEIAAALDLSPGVVDNFIFSARNKLGGVSRRVAARMLLAEEGAMQSPHVPRLHVAAPSSFDQPSGAEPSHEAIGSRREVREEQVPFEHPQLDHLASGWGRRNRLTKPQRVLVAVLLTAVVAIGSFAALATPLLLEALHAR